MNFTRRSLTAAAVGFVSAFGVLGSLSAHAENAQQLADNGRHTLNTLLATQPRARLFERHARAVLVFPGVLKAGFVFGGETGNGVLLEHGRPAGFYNLSGGSWGLQAGGQDFSYVMFIMNDNGLKYLRQSAGFQLGTGPSIVVINKGAATEGDTTTLTQDIYAFPFNQKGLMAGLDIEGSKITPIHKS